MTNRPEKGDKAPEVTLPATGDTEINLGRPAGKGHVVFFYPKDNTKGCTTEAIDFTSLKPKFAELGFDIIGVSKDSLKSHASFQTKQSLEVTLASDTEGTACEAFGVWVEKSMYGKTYMGIERSTFVVLADGTLHEVWRKVRVKGHAEAVFEAVAAL
ncbi:MAG: peroxiredoxin [Pseudomonadota bacterium]